MKSEAMNTKKNTTSNQVQKVEKVALKPTEKAKSPEKAIKLPAKTTEKAVKAEKVTIARLSRGVFIYKALKEISPKGKTITELAEIANSAFVKAGGDDNAKQTLHHIKVLMPAAIAWGVVSVKGDLYFS